MAVLSVIFWGVIVLSLLVFVHEGGHYLAARAFNVRVTEFFLGMPFRYRLSRKSKTRGTEFGVTPLLLGGYTRICGMEGVGTTHLADVFAIVQREGLVSAEAIGAELGIEVDEVYENLAALEDWASIRPYYDPELGERPYQRDYPQRYQTVARDASMRTEYDRDHDFSQFGSTGEGEPRPIPGNAAEFLEEERAKTYLGVGFTKRVVMLLGGPLVNIVLAFVLAVGCLMVMGYSVASNSNVISAVVEDSPAERAGLRGGDAITAIDGTTVETWEDITDVLGPFRAQGGTFPVTYERDGATVETLVTMDPETSEEGMGIYASVEVYHPTLPEACRAAVAYGGMVASFAIRLIVPTQTMEVLESSSSVVGISVMAAEAASSGVADLVALIAAVSMSLGFMNLLPIPPLDGGKIVIEVIQLVSRRTIPLRVQLTVSYVGFALFLMIFFYALRNDIVNIMGG